MSWKEFDELDELQPTPRNKWWWLLKLLITILTSVLTAFGVASCAVA